MKRTSRYAVIAGPHPHHGRHLLAPEGGRLTFLLLLVTMLEGLSGVSMVPVLPAVRRDFAGDPRVDLLVPVAVSVYALSAAIFAPIVGVILDHGARRKLLVGGLVAYALFGTAPLWVTSLDQLVITRVLLGVATAAVFTSAIVLLCDARQGLRWARFVGGMCLLTCLAAAGFFALAGYLGVRDWRATSWLYTVALALAALLAIALRRQRSAHSPRFSEAYHNQRRRVRWELIAPGAGLTLFTTIIFYSPTATIAETLEQVGITSTWALGVVSAIVLVGTAFGSLIYFSVTFSRPTIPLTVSLAFAAAGFLIVATSGGFRGTATVVVVVVGLTVASAGCGLVLPAMFYWFSYDLAPHERARGLGIMVGSFYLGVFLSPMAAQVLTRMGGVLAFFGALAGLSLILALATGAAALDSFLRARFRCGSHGVSGGG